MSVRVTYSDHLVALVAEAAVAAARIAAAPPGVVAAQAAAARREAARLSTRLDGSPLTDDTADAVDAGTWSGDGAVEALVRSEGGTGWAAALRLDTMATQEVAAVEYANVLACHDAQADLADSFFDAPLEALRAMHGLLCRGLVEPGVVARPRRTAQAIHDGAQGRVIFNTPDPEVVPGLLEGLVAWLGGAEGAGSAALPGVLVAAIVHERILHWQPFEAANGRLARAAARLVLRSRGVDGQAVSVPERALAADPGGYYGEIAATIRRRGDLTLWLERHTEAVAAALEEAADRVAPTPAPAVPARARSIADGLGPGEALTVTDYAVRAGVGRERAVADLRTLRGAGLVVREPRSRGLRFRRAG